ncbi:hypothetical protein CEXT_558821 [Caerostris extrusa]|uniref:Uncharacterized protein n=1 Tax=Caerostris extrusa TaxID=172846 RepID=A0AAV4XW12_CAEEX|nr:hypothetical protein CEXT_558821 [Caerostris extrusa]
METFICCGVRVNGARPVRMSVGEMTISAPEWIALNKIEQFNGPEEKCPSGLMVQENEDDDYWPMDVLFVVCDRNIRYFIGFCGVSQVCPVM